MAMTIFMQGSKWDIDVKNRQLDSVGEGEGGRTWESSIEKCILPYVKQMTNESSVHEAGHPASIRSGIILILLTTLIKVSLTTLDI